MRQPRHFQVFARLRCEAKIDEPPEHEFQRLRHGRAPRQEVESEAEHGLRRRRHKKIADRKVGTHPTVAEHPTIECDRLKIDRQAAAGRDMFWAQLNTECVEHDRITAFEVGCVNDEARGAIIEVIEIDEALQRGVQGRQLVERGLAREKPKRGRERMRRPKTRVSATA